MTSHFKPTAKELFFSKNDKLDPRLGDLAKPLSPDTRLQPNDWVILSYPDDEGIANNGGRLGASLGPQEIKKSLYKMTPADATTGVLDLKIWDGGELARNTLLLDERHKVARQTVAEFLQTGARVLALGGGHDYAYADGAAFLQANLNSKARPLVINFDAHLDVRSTEKGINSGTPFFRLLNEFPHFEFIEIGIQRQCNSQNHLKWVHDKGGRVIFYEDMLYSGKPFSSYILDVLSERLLQRRPCYLSIDIDGFSNAYAPGASQSFATGFEPGDFIRLLRVLKSRLEVQVAGIYEVSPPLDFDNHTAKLAALLAHQLLF